MFRPGGSADHPDRRARGPAEKLDETAFGDLLNALFTPPNFGPPGGKPAEPKKEEKKP